jgi:hypothetical protein
MSSTVFPNTGHPHANEVFFRSPTYVDHYDMAASSANNITIPSGGQYVRLMGNFDFYAKWGSTGASTAAATNGSASELVSLQSGGIYRNIGSTAGTTAISAISTGACVVTAAWWSV